MYSSSSDSEPERPGALAARMDFMPPEQRRTMEEQFSAVLKHAGNIVSRLKTPTSTVINLLRRLKNKLNAKERAKIRRGLMWEIATALRDGGIPPGIVIAMTKVFVNISMDDIELIYGEPDDSITLYMRCRTVGALCRARDMSRSGRLRRIVRATIRHLVLGRPRMQLFIQNEDYNRCWVCFRNESHVASIKQMVYCREDLTKESNVQLMEKEEPTRQPQSLEAYVLLSTESLEAQIKNVSRFQLTDDRFRDELLADIDASDELLDQLKKRKVLSLAQISDITSMSESRRRETLWQCLVEREVQLFPEFQRALTNARQQHVVERYLEPCSYRRSAKLKLSPQKFWIWVDCNYEQIVDLLDPDNGLMQQLLATHCFSADEVDHIESGISRHERSSRIIECLRQKDDFYIISLTDCLKRSKQRLSLALMQSSAVAHITLVGDSSGTLEKMSEKFGSALMKRKGRLFDAFRKGLGSDIELIDVRTEQSLSIYVGCQSRKSVHRLDKAFQSGRLLNVLRECTSCVVDEADVINIQWDASDFNRCIQYFHNLSVIEDTPRVPMPVPERCVQMDFAKLPVDLQELLLIKTIVAFFMKMTTRDADMVAVTKVTSVCSLWWHVISSWKWNQERIRHLLQLHKKALAVEGTDLENVAEESGEEVCSEDRAKHGEMNVFTSRCPYRSSPLLLSSRRLKDRKCGRQVFVKGVAQLDNVLYAVSLSSTILRFAADTLRPLGANIHVDGMTRPIDLAVCRDDRQLYVVDWAECVWRVSADDQSYERWLSTESVSHTFRVWSLSMRSRRLLMSLDPRSLYQYSTTDRQLLRVVQLPGYVKRLSHGVETTRCTFVVGYRGTPADEKQFAVSEVNVNGELLSLFTEVDWPRHLSTDVSGHVLVAEHGSDRILLLNDSLQLERVLVEPGSQQAKLRCPRRLSYNESTSRLCVLHSGGRSDIISLFSLR